MCLTACTKNTVYDKYLLFFRESGISVLARQRVPRWSSPIKILGTKLLMSFPDRQHFTHLSKLTARGTKCLPYESAGRGLLEAYTWFSSHFAHAVFLCWFWFISFCYNVTSNFCHHLSHFTLTWCPFLLFHWENNNGQKGTFSLCGWATLTSFCQLYLGPCSPTRPLSMWLRFSLLTTNEPKPDKFPINFYPCLHLTWKLEEQLLLTQMVNGYETRGGEKKNPGSCQCRHASSP